MNTDPHNAGAQPGPPPYGPPFGAPPGYGPPVPPYGPAVPYGPGPTSPSGTVIAGFVVALVGLVLFWTPILGLLLSVVGLVLSARGLSQVRRTGQSSGLATTGVVMGIVGLVPGIFFLSVFAFPWFHLY
jgi:hypothetical protein